MRAFALCLVLLACAPPKPDAPKTFSVSRGFIRDPEGRAVILRGANVPRARGR